MKSLISEEFQIPTDIVLQGQQQQQQEQKQGQGQRVGEIQEEEFDPLTFFISVGIAYLGFLEDQEVSFPDSHYIKQETASQTARLTFLTTRN